MSSFVFPENTPGLSAEVQVRVMMAGTGPAGRIARYGEGKDITLLDKNAAVIANNTYAELGISDDKMGDVCVFSGLAVLASGSVDGQGADYSQQNTSRNKGEQTKDTVLLSIKGASAMEVRSLIARCNDRAGGMTGGDTVIIRLQIRMYRSGDRRGYPTDEREITVEVGLVGDETKYHSLIKHGLIPDNVYGAVFTGKFSPLGGYDVNAFAPCLKALAREATAPFFSGFAPEIMNIAKASPFGVTAGQATNAVLFTLRVPEGQELLKLPTMIFSPTGMFDHPSHHAGPGQVPQLMLTPIQWFLNGHRSMDGNFELRKGDAGSEQVKFQEEHGRAYKDVRAARRARRHENSVKQRPKGADIGDLQPAARQRRGAGEKAKADGRKSRSRSRSPQREGGDEGGGGRGKAIRQINQVQGAMLGMQPSASGPGGAATQYSVSAADESLFAGVPGLTTGTEAPGPSTAPAAHSGAGTSELEQAAGAQLPGSLPASPHGDASPMQE